MNIVTHFLLTVTVFSLVQPLVDHLAKAVCLAVLVARMPLSTVLCQIHILVHVQPVPPSTAGGVAGVVVIPTIQVVSVTVRVTTPRTIRAGLSVVDLITNIVRRATVAQFVATGAVTEVKLVLPVSRIVGPVVLL
jgi:hypothetical protein